MSETEELRIQSEKHAQEHHHILNPDKTIVDNILKGLLNNKHKHGDIYCPCRTVTGDKEKDKKIVCPCTYHEQEIKDYEHCLCNLFVAKKEK